MWTFSVFLTKLELTIFGLHNVRWVKGSFDLYKTAGSDGILPKLLAAGIKIVIGPLIKKFQGHGEQ